MKATPERNPASGKIINVGFTNKSDDPDAPDDLNLKSAGEETKPIDPVELEHGRLVFIDGATVKLNPPAVAKKFAVEKAVAFSAKDDSFFTYDNEEGIWIKLERQSVVWLVSGFLKTIADNMKAEMVLPKRTVALLKSVLELVKGCSPMGDHPPPSAKLLPVANGVLDLSGPDPVLRQFKRDDWFTSKLPWPYVKGARCERFLNELVRPALVDLNEVSVLQRDLGRQLITGNEAQTITVIFGEGGSGKSVLVSIHEKIIGKERVAHLRSDQLKGRFETHAFHGKATLVGKDVKPDYLSTSGASMIKSLTGADRIESEKKYGGKFELRGSFFVVITANSRLRIKLDGDASAWRRRLVCYNFTRETPAKRIPNFDEVLLREEGSGILTWWVEGYLAHQRELREHGTLKLTQDQQRRVDDWIMESEVEIAFARTHISKGKGTLSVQAIFDRYTRFAEQRGCRRLSEQTFNTRFPAVMLELFNVDRSNHIPVPQSKTEVRGYKGVIFTAKMDNPDTGESV